MSVSLSALYFAPLVGRNLEASRYNGTMARGWESKSVEEQMAAGPQQSTAISGGGPDVKRQQLDKANRARQLQALNLQKENLRDLQ